MRISTEIEISGEKLPVYRLETEGVISGTELDIDFLNCNAEWVSVTGEDEIRDNLKAALVNLFGGQPEEFKDSFLLNPRKVENSRLAVIWGHGGEVNREHYLFRTAFEDESGTRTDSVLEDLYSNDSTIRVALVSACNKEGLPIRHQRMGVLHAVGDVGRLRRTYLWYQSPATNIK